MGRSRGADEEEKEASEKRGTTRSGERGTEQRGEERGATTNDAMNGQRREWKGL